MNLARTARILFGFASLTACTAAADDTLSQQEQARRRDACDLADGGVKTPSPASTTPTSSPSSASNAPDASPSSPATPSPLPVSDLEAAQAFVASLVIGVNVERGYAWDMPGESPSTSTQYWKYLKDDVHVTHVRLFYPWRPSLAMGGGGANNAPPDQGQFDRILDAASQAMATGLKVFLDCTDVMGTEDFEGTNGAATASHMENCATWTAARNFDKSLFALGPVNEWAGGDNDTYNALRKQYHDVLRAKLPGYVLTTGPAYWKSRDYLYDASKKFETFADERVVYEWHHYSTLDAAGWNAEEAKLEAWRNANGGRPTICGEAGAGYWDQNIGGQRLANSPATWPALFDAQLPAIAKERPSLWAITYGGEYRLNGNGARVLEGESGKPNLLQMIVDNGATMRAKLGL